jgi:hypothetical protein
MLPAMNKARLMMRDVEQTGPRMTHFKKFLLEQIDFHHLAFEENAVSLVFEEGFAAHTVAGSVWPASVLQPTTFNDLKLPPPFEVEIFLVQCTAHS